MNTDSEDRGRRGFLNAIVSGAVVAVAGCASSGMAGHAAVLSAAPGDEDVSPGEDLMREHGILRRVLFLYDEVISRLESGREVPMEVLVTAAGLIRRVIEDYHEKLEEHYVFPRLERAGQQVALIDVLRHQHVAGRRVTESIVEQAKSTSRDLASRMQLANTLRSFNRMYRPHAAREDTVLFPAFHKVIGGKEYQAMGDLFEDEEQKVLGERGFEDAVGHVLQLEVALEVGDLARFTP